MQQNNQAYVKTVKTREYKPQREAKQAPQRGKQWQRHDKAQTWQTLN